MKIARRVVCIFLLVMPPISCEFFQEIFEPPLEEKEFFAEDENDGNAGVWTTVSDMPTARQL